MTDNYDVEQIIVEFRESFNYSLIESVLRSNSSDKDVWAEMSNNIQKWLAVKLTEAESLGIANGREEERYKCIEIVEMNKLPVPNPYGNTVKVENVNKKILDKIIKEIKAEEL